MQFKTLLLTLLLACCYSLCPAEEEELSPKHKTISYVLKQDEVQPVLEALDDEQIQDLSAIERWDILGILYANTKHPAVIQALINQNNAPLIKEGELETIQTEIDNEDYYRPIEAIVGNSTISVEQRLDFVQQLLAKGESMRIYAFFLACQSGEKELIALCLKDKSWLKYSLYHLIHLNPDSALEQQLEPAATDEGRAEAIRYKEKLEVNLKESFSYLVEQGADINQDDEYSNSLVSLVLNEVNLSMLKLLIEQGLDIKALNDDEESLLHLACSASKRTNIIAFLLQEGLDIKARNKWGETPLLLYCEYGNVEGIQFLLENGAELKEVDDEENNVLHNACWGSGNQDVISFLLKQGMDINTRNKNGQTPLLAASEGGNYKLIPFLIEQGADITAIGSDRCTILHTACHQEEPDFELLALALEKGVDINALEDESEATALMLACHYNNLKLASWLLEKGANIELTDSTGCTAMHYACFADEEYDPEEMIKLLLKHGADINAPDAEGMTPLMFSCTMGKMVAVRALVKQGADVNLRADGCYALDFAIFGAIATQNKEVFCYMFQHQSWFSILETFSTYIYLVFMLIIVSIIIIIALVRSIRKKKS